MDSHSLIHIFRNWTNLKCENKNIVQCTCIYNKRDILSSDFVSINFFTRKVMNTKISQEKSPCNRFSLKETVLWLTDCEVWATDCCADCWPRNMKKLTISNFTEGQTKTPMIFWPNCVTIHGWFFETTISVFINQSRFVLSIDFWSEMVRIVIVWMCCWKFE